MNLRPVLFTLMLAATGVTFAASETTPTLGGSGESDLTCEPMPGEAEGHFVCEDPDSFKRCKEIEEAKGAVRLEEATEDTPVVMCMQGG